MLNIDNKFWFDKDSNVVMTGTISADKIKLPTTTQTVNWNPEEYELIKVDTEKGIIEFKKIEDE